MDTRIGNLASIARKCYLIAGIGPESAAYLVNAVMEALEIATSAGIVFPNPHDWEEGMRSDAHQTATFLARYPECEENSLYATQDVRRAWIRQAEYVVRNPELLKIPYKERFPVKQSAEQEVVVA